MLTQIIAEGPTDREILKALIKKICVGINLEFLRESKSQMKNRGKHSILFRYEKLSKFLHYGFKNSVELIVIMVDNDGGKLDSQGIAVATQICLEELVRRFSKENGIIYPGVNPSIVYAIPVETMDYWMKVIDMNTLECDKIIKTLELPRETIKYETYGRENIYLGWIIDKEALNKKIKKVERDDDILNKLSCLPSFNDFRNQLISVFNQETVNLTPPDYK